MTSTDVSPACGSFSTGWSAEKVQSAAETLVHKSIDDWVNGEVEEVHIEYRPIVGYDI